MNLRALLPGLRPDDLAAAAVMPPPVLDLASPWAPTHALAPVLEGLVFSEIFGQDVNRPMTRAEAMRVPAVKRARNIICGTVAAQPLRRYGRDGQLLADQGWAGQATASQVPPAHRHAMTADDLLFYGWSCWSRVNGADGFPLRVDRIAWGRWSVDEVGRVLVDDGSGRHVLVDQRTVILIPGLAEGILGDSSGTIRHAADLQAAAATAARTPAAYLALRQTEGTPLKRSSEDPEENTVQTVVDDWRAARAGLGGGVAFVPRGLVAEELGTFSEHLLVEGRNAAAVDVARITSLPADLLDASGPSSLTYSNSRDNDRRGIQYGVGLYLTPIQAVLAQDTVTPHGQVTRFDLAEWLQDPVSDVSRETGTPAAVPAAPAPPATPPAPALEVVR